MSGLLRVWPYRCPRVEHTTTEEMKLRAARRKKWQARQKMGAPKVSYLKVNEGTNREHRRHGGSHPKDAGTLGLKRAQRRAVRASIPRKVFNVRGRMR